MLLRTAALGVCSLLAVNAPPPAAATCTPAFLGTQMQAATESCGHGDPFVPQFCTVQCASMFTKLYEHCADLMDAMGLQHTAGQMVFREFYDLCRAQLSEEAVDEACSDDDSWHPTGSSTGVCQNALETASEAQGGQPAGACARYIAAGVTCDTGFCADCDYAGYCDLECGFCEEVSCEHFAAGEEHGCECDRVSGIKHCQASCNAFCHADKIPGGVPRLEVGRKLGAVATADGSFSSVCEARTGRSEWFQFHAAAGHEYKINTILQEGGLGAASLYLHRIDSEQTEVAASRAWHCDLQEHDADLTQLRATCMLWACVEAGDYAIRVAQTQGTGAYQIEVENYASLVQISATNGLTPDFDRTPGHLQSFMVHLQVVCQYTYCNYAKFPESTEATAASLPPAPPAVPLAGDGNSVIMALTGDGEQTFKFIASLWPHAEAPSPSAVYIKVNIFADYPSPDVIVDSAAMVHEFKLGHWTEKPDGDDQYEETNKNYDMESYRHFPNLDAPNSAQWPWRCPGKGQYYAVLSINCDVPLLDDVTANMGSDGQPIGNSFSCTSAFSFEVQTQ